MIVSTWPFAGRRQFHIISLGDVVSTRITAGEAAEIGA
jgi:hypothetical protein